jgi:LAO/AO transport system kinase
MKASAKKSVDAYVSGLTGGDRRILAKAITLVESQRSGHAELARRVIQSILPDTGGAYRIGITGTPGAGKSTLINSFGLHLAESGYRVAVLAVDPSSTRSGGSILGDKTRMTELSNHNAAFVRPTPTSGQLGGVAAHTREAVLLCEAAGFDVVLVETVGVGQSELEASNLTDFLIVLALAGAGDELQGIKRGLLEVVDLVAVNKADGEGKKAANRAANIFRRSLEVLRGGGHGDVVPPVLTCSGLKGDGLADIWDYIVAQRATAVADGALERRRGMQSLRWMWQSVDLGLRRALDDRDDLRDLVGDLESCVLEGSSSPTEAAHQILTAVLGLPR